MVKGIGPVYAGKLVAKFGEKIFDVIDECSARLEEVEGIGPARRKRIKEAWAEQKFIRQIMVFLHSHGVSTSRAVRIYKTYGESAIGTFMGSGSRLLIRLPSASVSPVSRFCAPKPDWGTFCSRRSMTDTAPCPARAWWKRR
jgi:exodeoxyribonuclease V alpha subunit